MATIYLIRHGQASFGSANYDQLSNKGMEQSRILGKHWHSAPDKVYSGSLLRHEQTLEHFFLGLQTKPVSRIQDSGFNEFDHRDILACYRAEWSDLKVMTSQLALTNDFNRAFQVAFSDALQRWASEDHSLQYKESWSQFKARCVGALHDVIAQARAARNSQQPEEATRDICIFTSAGPIAVIIQHLLSLNDEKTLMLTQQLRNTSVTKILFSKHSINIDYFNNYSHLKSDDWATFR